LPLLRELFYIFAVIIIIGYMFERKNLFISLVFASSFENPFTLKHLLFSVAITDLVLKLLTVAVKILITMLPPSIVDYKGRVGAKINWLKNDLMIFGIFAGAHLFDDRSHQSIVSGFGAHPTVVGVPAGQLRGHRKDNGCDFVGRLYGGQGLGLVDAGQVLQTSVCQATAESCK
jgi:hypothetical protein